MDDDRVRVVVVDDDEDSAQSLSFLAEMHGCEVWIAHDGIEALETIAAHRPHCVITDMKMPRMDGIALVIELRRVYGSELVLVAMTGRDSEDSRIAPVFALVDHYLRKPVDPVVLERLLRPEGLRGAA